MSYSTIPLSKETREKLDDIYYPLRKRKKVMSYGSMIELLIRYYRKYKEELKLHTDQK